MNPIKEESSNASSPGNANPDNIELSERLKRVWEEARDFEQQLRAIFRFTVAPSNKDIVAAAAASVARVNELVDQSADLRQQLTAAQQALEEAKADTARVNWLLANNAAKNREEKGNHYFPETRQGWDAAREDGGVLSSPSLPTTEQGAQKDRNAPIVLTDKQALAIATNTIQRLRDELGLKENVLLGVSGSLTAAQQRIAELEAPAQPTPSARASIREAAEKIDAELGHAAFGRRLPVRPEEIASIIESTCFPSAQEEKKVAANAKQGEGK